VPFVTGTYATTTGTANPFTTVERKDVGLTLKVKPQISEGGTVRLQIYQEASAVIEPPPAPPARPPPSAPSNPPCWWTTAR
jgi:general secretion pathway protein D